jgi:hypothetical protein
MEVFLKFVAEQDDYGSFADGIKIEQVYCLNKQEAFKIVREEYTPKMSDKLYFLPGVNIPRIKLKEFALKYHIKTTRDITEADVIFGGNLSNHKVITRQWRYSVKTEYFKACFEALIELDKLDERTIERISTALEFYTQDTILSDHRSILLLGDANLYNTLVINPAYELMQSRQSLYADEVEEEYLELVRFLENTEVLNEDALLKHINGDDAVLINKEVYQQLQAMFDSSDRDNWVLGMEILANSKYTESLFYILKLLSQNCTKLRECKSVDHVNFKSLLSYLGISKHNMDFNVDKKIQKLMDKGVLTTGMLNALIRDELYNPSTFHSTMVQIKTVTVNENIAKYLNKNYEFRYLSDFEPEIEAPKEEVVVIDQTPTWL